MSNPDDADATQPQGPAASGPDHEPTAPQQPVTPPRAPEWPIMPPAPLPPVPPRPAAAPQPPVAPQPAAPTWSAAAAPPPPPPPVTPFPPAGAVGPPPAVPPRTMARAQRQSRTRALTALAAACFLACAAFLGYSIGANHDSSSVNASSNVPSQQIPSNGSSSSGSSSNGSSSNGSSSSGGSSQQTNVDVQAIAAKISPSIVNLTSATSGGEAAGTGILISSNGLVITNNHVIANSTQLEAEIGGDGNEHAAKVLGYSIGDDVALVQIEDVSGLTAASLGDSSDVQVGDAIVALGNAGGKGGSPTVVSGSVTATDQQITASDQDGSNAETLSNLIQIDANIQPGDSGGALVDADGKVVGMNAAASSGNGGFGFGGQSANEGYAIPVEHALDIAKQIQGSNASDSVHVGSHAGILGVSVAAATTSNGNSPFGGNGDFGGSSQGSGTSTGNGASVQQVQSGSGADSAGIDAGSTITAVDGTAISSGEQLTHTMVRYNPGDKVKVEWTDSNGQSHTATVELGSGPPA